MDATSLEGMKKVANRFSARRGTPPWWNEIKEPRTVATAQNFVNSIITFFSHLKKKNLPFLQNGESDQRPSWERKVKTSDCCQYTKSKPVWYWKRSLCFLAPRSALVCFSFGSLRAVKSSFFLKNSSQSSDTMVFAWFPRRWDALRKVHSVKVTHKMRLVMQGQQSWQHLDNNLDNNIDNNLDNNIDKNLDNNLVDSIVNDTKDFAWFPRRMLWGKCTVWKWQLVSQAGIGLASYLAIKYIIISYIKYRQRWDLSLPAAV